MVSPDSDRVSRVRPYSGTKQKALFFFAYGALTLYRLSFQRVWLKIKLLCCLALQPQLQSNWFRLFPVRSPLLGESLLISFPPPTKMFQFGGYCFFILCIQIKIMEYYFHWVPPFGNPRIEALLAAPRGFSQPHTTFFGFWSLGIRHLHLIIFLHTFY